MFDMFDNDPAAGVELIHNHTALYTKNPIVEKLLDQINWPRYGGLLLDPGCGDGAFLVAALQRLNPSRNTPSDVTQRLIGCEFHPGAARDARKNIADHLIENGWSESVALNTAANVVHIRDFLKDGCPAPTVNVIAGNPPYMRFAKLGKYHKDLYQSIVPDYAQGDLLFAFLGKVADILHPDGVIAAVTSDRWLSNEGTSKLRAQIGETLGISHLERLDGSSAFYQPKTRRKGTPPRVHPVALVLSHAASAPIPMTAAPVNIGDPHAIRYTGPTLQDIATIKLAPWLGSDGIFTVDAATAKRLPKEFLVPCVNAKGLDMKNRCLREISQWAIRTCPEISPPKIILDHIDANYSRMSKRGRRTPRWVPPEPFANRYPLEQESILIPRIAKTICPIRLPAGIVPTNHQISVITHPTDLDRIEQILLSDDAHQWLKANVPAIDNGYYNIRTGLIKTLPVHF